MTNAEQIENFRKRELELRNVFNESREITEEDKMQYSLSDTHYQMRLAYAKQQDSLDQANAESTPLNVKMTSEVKIKR